MTNKLGGFAHFCLYICLITERCLMFSSLRCQSFPCVSLCVWAWRCSHSGLKYSILALIRTVDSSRQSILSAEPSTSAVCLRIMLPGMFAGRVDTAWWLRHLTDSPGVSRVLLSIPILLKVCVNFEVVTWMLSGFLCVSWLVIETQGVGHYTI